MKVILLLFGILFSLAVILFVGGNFIGDDSKDFSNFSNGLDTSDPEFWIDRIDEFGAEQAYLEFKSANNNLTAGDKHTQAHIIGEVLYSRLGAEGLVVCDDSFAFGCYHGFFGSAVSEEGIDSMPKFDQACFSKFEAKFGPCQHGIGHALLVYYGLNSLQDSLDECRKLIEQGRQGCSSGVFMEYNFQTITHRDTKTRELDLEGPYFPCDDISEDFRSSCYAELPQWWYSVFSGDYTKMSGLCFGAEGVNTRKPCFNGAGKIFAHSLSNYDVDKTVEVCGSMPSSESIKDCIEGASWIFLVRKDGVLPAQKVCKFLSDNLADECLKKLETNSFFEES